MTRYYRLEARRLAFSELRRMAPGPAGWLLAVWVKILRRPIDFKTAYARPENLAIVGEEEVEGGALLRMNFLCEALEPFGFAPVFRSAAAWLSPVSKTWTTALLHQAGEVFASVVDTEQKEPDGRARRLTHLVFWSRLRGGGFLSTFDHDLKLETPAEFGARAGAGLSPEPLLALHRQRLAGSPGGASRIRAEELPEVALGLSQLEADYFIERGVYVPMSAEEVEAFRVSSPPSEPAQRRAGRSQFLKSVLLWIVIFSSTLMLWNLFKSAELEAPPLGPPGGEAYRCATPSAGALAARFAGPGGQPLGLHWELEGEGGESLRRSLAAYLGLPREMMLSPPWAPGESAEQAWKQRWTVFVFYREHLRRSLEESSVREGLRSLAGLDLSAAAVDRFIEAEGEAIRSLLEGQPSLDAEMAGPYLLWLRRQREPTGHSPLNASLELGQGLGQLEFSHATVGEERPRGRGDGAAHQAWVEGLPVGWLDGEEEALGIGLIPNSLRYMSFEDVQVGLPALLDFLCAHGAETAYLWAEEEGRIAAQPSSRWTVSGLKAGKQTATYSAPSGPGVL